MNSPIWTTAASSCGNGRWKGGLDTREIDGGSPFVLRRGGETGAQRGLRRDGDWDRRERDGDGAAVDKVRWRAMMDESEEGWGLTWGVSETASDQCHCGMACGARRPAGGRMRRG